MTYNPNGEGEQRADRSNEEAAEQKRSNWLLDRIGRLEDRVAALEDRPGNECEQREQRR
jgi:hypothetical protein